MIVWIEFSKSEIVFEFMTQFDVWTGSSMNALWWGFEI